MANAKGTDIVSLQKIVSQKSIQVQEAFLRKLTPELRQFYQKMSCLKWGSLESMLEVYTIAAEILYPGDPEGFLKLGKEMAAKSYTLVYRFFLNFPSISFIIKTASQVWSSYHERGVPSVEKVALNCYDFVVKQYEEMPAKMLIVAECHFIVIMEIAGRKNVRVKIFDNNCAEWRWRVTWDE